jgi:hypothetical protein
MEGVDEERFTQVFITKRGRPVRVDLRLLASEAPGSGGDAWARREWAQEIAGTPFERVLREALTEIVLEPDGAATRVTIVQRQRLRGASRTGGLLLRRATKKKLDEALDGLEQILG